MQRIWKIKFQITQLSAREKGTKRRSRIRKQYKYSSLTFTYNRLKVSSKIASNLQSKVLNNSSESTSTAKIICRFLMIFEFSFSMQFVSEVCESFHMVIVSISTIYYSIFLQINKYVIILYYFKYKIQYFFQKPLENYWM